IHFQTSNSAKHTLDFGNKDFTGSSVYARIDGSASVAVLPASLLESADKSVSDLRDKAVLHLASADVQSFDLRTASGEIAASRAKSGWKLSKPSAEPADEQTINDLLTAVSGAKMIDVASEQPKDLARYGLGHPAISFSAKDKAGKTSILLLGTKHGGDFYARDASRPIIFTVDAALEEKLAAKYPALRDKKITELQQGDVKEIALHDPNGEIAIGHSGDKWTFETPADQKGKQAETWKVFSAIMDARATAIIDHPSKEIDAKLAKPAVELTLTQNDGTKWTLQLSPALGSDTYARVSDRKPVYKLPRDVIQSLSLKPADLAF